MIDDFNVVEIMCNHAQASIMKATLDTVKWRVAVAYVWVCVCAYTWVLSSALLPSLILSRASKVYICSHKSTINGNADTSSTFTLPGTRKKREQITDFPNESREKWPFFR